jgi:hypothetical protein
MLLIGASGKNSGKTTLARECIRQWKDLAPVTALKITTVSHRGACCPRGEDGCGECANIPSGYILEEEKGASPGKDTALLLQAGARRVFWLRSLRSSLEQGFAGFLEQAPEDSLIICESNSLRELVEPGCFIMLHNLKGGAMKPSAARVEALADFKLQNPPDQFLGNDELHDIIARIHIDQNGRRPLSIRFTSR